MSEVPGVPKVTTEAEFEAMSFSQKMRVWTYYVPAYMLSISKREFKKAVSDNTVEPGKSLKDWPGFATWATQMHMAENSATGYLGPISQYNAGTTSATSTIEFGPSKSYFQKPRDYDDAAKSEISEMAHLWKGDETTGSDYDELRNKLTLWQNGSFGFNGMFYPPKGVTYDITDFSDVALSRGLSILRDIFKSGEAETIVNDRSLITKRADPRSLILLIEKHYKFNTTLLLVEKTTLLERCKCFAGHVNLSDWKRDVYNTYSRLNQIITENPAWASELPTEEQMIERLCSGTVGVCVGQSPYPPHLSIPISQLTLTSSLAPTMKIKTLDAFFSTLVEWEKANQVMVPKAEPIHGRIRTVTNNNHGSTQKSAQYLQLKTYPAGRKYGIVPSDWDGLTCIHMLLAPQGFNGAVNHRVPPQKNSSGAYQCVFGFQCKELAKCDEHFRQNYNSSWRHPHRPSPLPDYRDRGNRWGKGRGKGHGRGGRSRGGGRGSNRSTQYGSRSFDQTRTRAERARRVGNCAAYLSTGKCPLKSRCPKADAHGYRDGVLLTQRDVQKIKVTSNKDSEAQQLKRDMSTIAKYVAEAATLDKGINHVAKRARVEPATKQYQPDKDIRREAILRIAKAWDKQY